MTPDFHAAHRPPAIVPWLCCPQTLWVIIMQHSIHSDAYHAATLGEIIRRHSALSAQDLIRHLHEEVARFSQGVHQMDDLTLVVLKRNP